MTGKPAEPTRTVTAAAAQEAEREPDFSLVLGGLLHQLWLRSQLARPPLAFLHRLSAS